MENNRVRTELFDAKGTVSHISFDEGTTPREILEHLGAPGHVLVQVMKTEKLNNVSVESRRVYPIVHIGRDIFIIRERA